MTAAVCPRSPVPGDWWGRRPRRLRLLRGLAGADRPAPAAAPPPPARPPAGDLSDLSQARPQATYRTTSSKMSPKPLKYYGGKNELTIELGFLFQNLYCWRRSFVKDKIIIWFWELEMLRQYLNSLQMRQYDNFYFILVQNTSYFATL